MKKGNILIIIALVASLLGALVGGAMVSLLMPQPVTQQEAAETKSVETKPAEITPASQASEATVPESSSLTVKEIVQQNEASVVTVVTKLIDEAESTERNFIGTGFILNGDGLIATNQHVISGADRLSVIFSDGTEVDAQEINSDAISDLAILKLTDNKNLPGIVSLGDSDKVSVGEQVVAIGSPVSRRFAGTVTSGILSGKNRPVSLEGEEAIYLQTDAAMNEGNSGGPLFNDRGEVIGINTAKMSSDVQGIGFAIPINILKTKLNQLSKPPIQLGFVVKDLSDEAKRNLKVDQGVEVIEVINQSAADQKGLRPQDIILSFDGTGIKNAGHLNQLKEEKQPGSQASLDILRQGKRLTVDLPLDVKGP